MNHRHHNHNDHTDHDTHAGHVTSSFLTLFWIALILTIPLFVYSDMAMMIGIMAPRFTGITYIEFILGSIVFFFCGKVFLVSAYHELRAKLPGMMTLIAMAIISAYAYSVYAVFFAHTSSLYFELSSLVTIMLLGHWIEMKSVQSAQGALKELAQLLPDTAELIQGNTTHVVSLSQLKGGDIVRIKPGAKIPADGKIIEGQSELNESIITGESKPVIKKSGNEVIAGSINGDGSLKVEVTKTGEKTFLAEVMKLVSEAQMSKSHLQILSDRAAFYLTYVAVVAGTITFGTWISVGAGLPTAIERLVAVLVIACPHALGLAIPLVAAISTSMAARNGLLIKNRLALENARNIDTIIFDKTGTLTEAHFKVTHVSSDDVLGIAASVNSHSEHPIAVAIVEEAKKRSLRLRDAHNFKRVPGRGVEGVVDGKHIFVGTKGGDDIVIEQDGKAIGTVAVADAIRPESKEAIDTLKRNKIKVVMVTGDSETAAQRVAKELEIDEYVARALPGDKIRKIKELQSLGRKVAMVGDGINDAPALAQADLGIAIGAGTNVAIESAGIILIHNDPRDIAKIFNLSRLTYTKMIQNLFWATGYNVVALPLAAGVLVSKGVILQPAIAAVLMSASTVIVAGNALLMRKRRI